MATVAISPTTLSMNTGQAITQGTGTAIVPANTNTIAYPREGKLAILIDSDHANTAVTFAVSDHFSALGQGTLTVAVGNAAMQLVIVDSARFKLTSGSLSIAYHADSAGFIQAYYLP